MDPLRTAKRPRVSLGWSDSVPANPGTRLRPRVETGILLILSALAGVCVVLKPGFAFGALILIGYATVVHNGLARLSFVVVGGMVVLNSSAGLSPAKIAYLIGAAFAIGIALLRLPRLTQSPQYPVIRAAMRVSALFGLFVVVELVLSVRGSGVASTVRDAGSYLMFAAVPLLALDASTSVVPRTLRAMLVGLGAIAAISFTLEWTANRGLVSMSATHLTLSGLLPAALFSY